MGKRLEEENTRLLQEYRKKREADKASAAASTAASAAAATRIQQQFRGFKTRKEMERKLEEENARLLESLRNPPAAHKQFNEQHELMTQMLQEDKKRS